MLINLNNVHTTMPFFVNHTTRNSEYEEFCSECYTKIITNKNLQNPETGELCSVCYAKKMNISLSFKKSAI